MNQEDDPKNRVTFAEPQTHADLGAALTVLADSFQTAENFAAIFLDVQARQRALRHLFRLLLRDAGHLGGVTVPRQKGDIGAAVWYGPGQAKLTFSRQLQTVPELARIFAAAPASFLRFARLGSELEKRTPSAPHRYLSALGISPAWHGGGVGSALLELGTAGADAQGLPCYLETFSEANVRFYRRRGFEVVAQGDDLIPGGPPF